MTPARTTLPGHVGDDLEALARLVGGGGAPHTARINGVALAAADRVDVANELYRRWYLRWKAPPEPRVPTAVAFDPPRALRAAHPATARFEPGWAVARASSSGRAVLVRDRCQRLLDRVDHFVAARPGSRAEPGDVAVATARVDEVDDRDGFWVTYHPEWDAGAALARVYWRVAPESAPRLTEVLLRRLGDVPHAFKVAAHRDGFARGDAAVLYLDRADWARAAPAVAAVAHAVGDGLAGAAPRLARPLADGLAVADGSADGASFGQRRCGLVADALLAWAAGADDLTTCLASAFDAAGLDLARPHLDAGNAEYAWPPADAPHVEVGAEPVGAWTAPASGGRAPEVSRLTRPAGDGSHGAVQRFLDGAVRLGDELCASAVWHEEGCLWLGAGSRQIGNQWRVVHESTGPDLYAGTAGIGLFLAHLAARTGDAHHLRSARGAFAHAARSVDAGDPAGDGPNGSGAGLTGARGGVGSRVPGPLGLHTGLAGIAWSAHRASTVTGDADLAAAARGLGAAFASGLSALDAPPASADLIDGVSGILVAALALAPGGAWTDVATDRAAARAGHAVGPDPPPARPIVRRLAGWLADTAIAQPVGVGWPGLGDGSPPLCGLGHGASGPALALLEAVAAAGGARDPEGGAAEAGGGARDAGMRLRVLAEAAMAYERSWFDRTRSNWPDLREFDRVALRTGKRPAAPVYWCHGAAGIGLQRLRAWELTGAPLALADLGAALQACGAQAAAVMASDPDEDPWGANVSVCHGACGVAGLLAAAGATLGDDGLVGLARALGGWMLDTFGQQRPWSCGVAGGGQTPGLMLGTSGVGMTLLQLVDPVAVGPVGIAPVGSHHAT